jgi:hypothetical protein
MLLLAENADLLFSLPSKLVLDVESFMASKMAVMETPKGKVNHSQSSSYRDQKKGLMNPHKVLGEKFGKINMRRRFIK